MECAFMPVCDIQVRKYILLKQFPILRIAQPTVYIVGRCNIWGWIDEEYKNFYLVKVGTAIPTEVSIWPYIACHQGLIDPKGGEGM